MRQDFKDYFSTNSADYKKYRPEYPEGLFAYLASLSPARERAWDCGTGSGQTAKGLAGYFKTVIATDPSRSQIENAERIDGIEYLVAPAENSTLESAQIDLVTVSQALHWFRIQDFFKEAARVLKPAGILAVWSYNLLSVSPDIDPIIADFYHKTIGDYWPPERKLVETGYNEIVFPFQEISPPAFAMQTEWNLPELIGYIATWSAVKEFRAANQASPIDDLYAQVRRCWQEPSRKMTVSWPLTLKIRKKLTSGPLGVE